MRGTSRFVFLFALLVQASCATRPQSDFVDNQSSDVLLFEETQVENVDLDESLLQAQAEALRNLRQREDQPVAAAPTYTYTINTRPGDPKVRKWIQYYSVKDRERFQRFLNRGAKYKSIVQELLVANGLPPDLYYLGILESGYVTKAVSHAGAVGPWQFMGPTGREYGLKINGYVDERVDPIRSTLAAIRYLKELYRLKKSWPMALAAYNAGPGRVRRAMRRGGSTNYWSLTQRRLLPYDTREYIPQFLAILTIGQNLDEYGFVERAKTPMPALELVKVPSPVSLTKIAELANIPESRLRKYNHHLIKGLTPPGKDHYPIWVDAQYVAKLEQAYDQIAMHRIPGLKEERFLASTNAQYHRVRRGQNLSTIARRYRTNVASLKRLNGLKSNRIFVGQRLRVRSGGGQVPQMIAQRQLATQTRVSKRLPVARKDATQKPQVASARVTRYRIRRGDNLYKIARKFGITVKQIKTMNNLRSNRILKGQYLIVAAQ